MLTRAEGLSPPRTIHTSRSGVEATLSRVNGSLDLDFPADGRQISPLTDSPGGTLGRVTASKTGRRHCLAAPYRGGRVR
jgi:hypothetical protein